MKSLKLFFLSFYFIGSFSPLLAASPSVEAGQSSYAASSLSIGSTWQSQWVDTKVQTFTDVRGAQWMLTLPPITEPHLYSLSKDGKTGYLLGLHHCMPLNCLCSEALTFIKEKCKSLVLETDQIPLQRTDLEKRGFLRAGETRENWWLHRMSGPTGRYLQHILTLNHSRVTRDYNIWELTPRAAMIAFSLYHQEGGMDDGLREGFSGSFSPLEEREETAKSLAQSPSFAADDFSVEDLQEAVGYYMGCGGFLSEPGNRKTIEDYSRGKPLLLEDDPSGPLRNRQWMASRWDNLFRTLPDPLFAPGEGHLYGPGGLLELLPQNGYTVGTRISFGVAGHA